MSILIYMLLAFWQVQYPPSPQVVPAPGPPPAAQWPAPPLSTACASVIIRNQNTSDQWKVCTVEQLKHRIDSVNPDFLAGKSNVLYKPGQASPPPIQPKH